MADTAVAAMEVDSVTNNADAVKRFEVKKVCDVFISFYDSITDPELCALVVSLPVECSSVMGLG